MIESVGHCTFTAVGHSRAVPVRGLSWAGSTGPQAWLRRHAQLLGLAEDETLPLASRVRYLAVFGRRLDQFFAEDVAGLLHPVGGAGAWSAQSADPALAPVYEFAGGLMARYESCYHGSVLPALNARGIQVLRYGELGDAERRALASMFRDRVYPLLTPLVVDPAHPFPRIPSLSLNLAVLMTGPRARATTFAQVKIPDLRRLTEVSRHSYMALEDLIAAHLPRLFNGAQLLEWHAFRVTRGKSHGWPVAPGQISRRLQDREPSRFRLPPAVRLEVEGPVSDGMVHRLMAALRLGEQAVYRLRGPLDLPGAQTITALRDTQRLTHRDR